MNEKEKYLLKNYQHLMEPYEQITARWLTEEWDGETQKMPAWLRHRVWPEFRIRNFGKPDSMVKVICLKLLQNHKHEIKLLKTKFNSAITLTVSIEK